MPTGTAATASTSLENLRTLLHSPTGADADDVAAVLKDLDLISVNEADHVTGDTALHVAARTAGLAVVRLLLAAGADPLRRNVKGRTPGKQLNIEGDVRTELEAAAAAWQLTSDAARAAVWAGAVQRTQTESAFGTQTL